MQTSEKLTRERKLTRLKKNTANKLCGKTEKMMTSRRGKIIYRFIAVLTPLRRYGKSSPARCARRRFRGNASWMKNKRERTKTDAPQTKIERGTP